jgi:RHS repeat-associated protein
VSYFHAGGIDRPLVITKGTTSIVPHQNWRGQFARGTYADGPNVGKRSDCVTYPASNCVPIQWPGERTTARHELEPSGEIHNWFGGLVDDMRDATGQMYRRNRYYDPQSGQFTQPDPIGLAGGLNEYGFAAGDPVSYGDPYGLKVELENDAARRLWNRLQRTITQNLNSRDAEKRQAAFDLSLSMRHLDASENMWSISVGRQRGLTGLDVRNNYGGAKTWAPLRGLFNDNARTLLDPVHTRRLWNMDPVITLAHESGHALAIMMDARDKITPSLQMENNARILFGCAPSRLSHPQLPAPCH